MAFRTSTRSHGRSAFSVVAVVTLWLTALAAPAGASAASAEPSNTPVVAAATPAPFPAGADTTPTPTPSVTPATVTPATDPASITLWAYKCPSYTDVPANKNPTNLDATGGHGGDLDTNYDVQLVDTVADVPLTCHVQGGVKFTLSAGYPGTPLPAATTSDTGPAVVPLDDTTIALVSNTT